MVAFWYSLGTVKPSISEWVDFPLIKGELTLFQIRKIGFPNVRVGKLYLRTCNQNNVTSERWEIIYPKNEFEIFSLPNLDPNPLSNRKIQVLKDSRSKTRKAEYTVEILVYNQPVEPDISPEITSQLATVTDELKLLSDRIDSLPAKLSQVNTQIEGMQQNEVNLVNVLLGIY
jgi:hypothetical protein